MKKSSLILIILIIIGLFAGADYYLNNLKDQPLPKIPKTPSDNLNPENSGFSDTFFRLNEDVLSYKVISQKQTSQIFEKIDLSNINNIKIYLDSLEKVSAPSQIPVAEATETTPPVSTEAKENNQSIYLYEIHGPLGQGSFTYLNVKLQFISQINATTEVLNETGEFGQNSFFYNDQDFANVAFLLTQVGDNLYAFQYNRVDPAIYNDVKSIISKIMPDKKSDVNITNP
jgi:hypothetical protein